jgi:hypothetical protein
VGAGCGERPQLLGSRVTRLGIARSNTGIPTSKGI